MSLSSSLFARLSTVASRLSSNKVSVAEHSPQISMPTTRSFQGNNQNVQRWKLQTGIQNVSQPSPVTSPARFLLCTMVLNGHE